MPCLALIPFREPSPQGQWDKLQFPHFDTFLKSVTLLFTPYLSQGVVFLNSSRGKYFLCFTFPTVYISAYRQKIKNLYDKDCRALLRKRHKIRKRFSTLIIKASYFVYLVLLWDNAFPQAIIYHTFIYYANFIFCPLLSFHFFQTPFQVPFQY